jgi:DNA repair exonuclease SbcCD ATPase subunit
LELDTLQNIEKELDVWSAYLDALKMLPYTIIAQVVPLLEQKVNAFLSNVADFMIKISVENGKIELYIDRPVYNGKYILLGNASGFERFISSLAIRLALMEISQLPKPNFIAIDEGWTSFDFNNIHNVGEIFEYLSSRFDIVINISHLQSIREHCTYHINLVKDRDGYSCVA